MTTLYTIHGTTPAGSHVTITTTRHPLAYKRVDDLIDELTSTGAGARITLSADHQLIGTWTYNGHTWNLED